MQPRKATMDSHPQMQVDTNNPEQTALIFRLNRMV